MVVGKVYQAAKWTTETVIGAAQALANTKGPVPATDLHPRMPARPWTAQEYLFYAFSAVLNPFLALYLHFLYKTPRKLRMWSWRHCWKYIPVFRFYVYSGIIMFVILKYVVPFKPRHSIMYHKGKADAHHHEVEHWYGIRQKKADALYFKKYNPLKKEGDIEVGGH